MNDNYKGDGGAEGFRLRMIAEQAVARMNSRMRRRIDEDACDGLVEAILKTGEPDKFLFRPEPYREAPPRWSLSGMIARTLCMVQRWRDSASKAADGGETLSTTHYNVKRSGAAGLVITLVVALLVGITDFGMPAEVGLQATRNLARPEIASGDILIPSS
jgi:hypothetical protein